MSTPADVSVVIPARNVAPWIGEAIASVAAQTHPAAAMEVILVDDASTDDTVNVARQALRASGIRHVIARNDRPAGPGGARNRGWRRAKSAWIQFLDGDDYLAPEKIAIQAAVAGRSPGSVAVVTSPWGRVRLADRQWRADAFVCDPTIGADALADLIAPEKFVAVHSYLARREWLEATGGFNETYRLVEDVEFLLRVAAAGGGFVRVPYGAPLAWYRQRPGSVSGEDERAFVEACVRNARFVEDQSGADQLSPARADAISRVYFQAARFFRAVDRVRFDELVAGIYRVSPNFVPSGPATLRRLARIVGYPRAEGLALKYRRLKGFGRLSPRA